MTDKEPKPAAFDPQTITEKHVQFLQACGQTRVTTVEEAIAFFAGQSKEDLAEGFKQFDLWLLAQPAEAPPAVPPTPLSSPEDTQDVTAAAAAVTEAATTENQPPPEAAKPAEVEVRKADRLPVGKRVRITKIDVGVYGVEGEITGHTEGGYKVKLLAPCYAGSVVDYSDAEVAPIS